jgi:PPM family protein phosphatase
MYRGSAERILSSGPGLFNRQSPSQLSMDIEFTEVSDRGRIREQNEDYFGHVAPGGLDQERSRGWLFVLADGVGGHDHGEVASRTAVEAVVQGFREAPSTEPHATLLPRLMQLANTRVLDAAHSAAGVGPGMATTLVACALRHDRLVVAHVGDSRCYLVRKGAATVLTRDHTVANEHVRLGLLSAEDAAESPNRHVLCRSVGSELVVAVETSQHQVQPGDVLVLCSDGLHGSVQTSEIGTTVSNGVDLGSAAAKLVALANERDGSDNITAQLIRIRTVERVGMYRGRPYRLP